VRRAVIDHLKGRPSPWPTTGRPATRQDRPEPNEDPMDIDNPRVQVLYDRVETALEGIELPDFDLPEPDVLARPDVLVDFGVGL
jgi:hypothetical protein